MSDRKPSPFVTLLNNDVCSLIQAAEDVYQIRFKNRAANAYLVRGSSRTIMIDIGLSSNFPHLLECLAHVDCAPDKIDMLILSHEHLDHIGAAYHFGGRTIIAAHRLAANKIMLRDDFSMLRKMFNEPNVPINVDIWLEEGNLIDLGNFRLNVMYTPGHTSACISLFDQDQGLLFAADTLMPGGVMGGVFGSGSISDYIQSLERLKGSELQDSAVRTRPAVGYAAGRCADRDPALACAVVRHRATVRRARRALELRTDHAVGARSQQVGRRVNSANLVSRTRCSALAVHRRAGTDTGAALRYDPGLAAHHAARAARCAASGERLFARHCEPTGRRRAPPDDRLREAIQRPRRKTGLPRRFAPRNDEAIPTSPPAHPAAHSRRHRASENASPGAATPPRCP